MPECTHSLGADAVDLTRLADLELDPWQGYALSKALGVGEDGKWAVYEATIATQRQNGKEPILGALQLMALFLWDERLIIHSAHEFVIAQESFQRVRSLIEGCGVLPHKVAHTYTSNDEEGVKLKSRNRLQLEARSRKSACGFTGSRIILDEALSLPRRFLGAIMPAVAAVSKTGNPQLWCTSSTDLVDSEVLEGLHARVVTGENAGSLCCLGWSTKSWDKMIVSERSHWDDDRAKWRADPEV